MGEAEQLLWDFFNMGRLIASMGFIGTIIAIWLAMRVANMTRESDESNIVTKILSSAFGLLVLAGSFQTWTIARNNWTNYIKTERFKTVQMVTNLMKFKTSTRTSSIIARLKTDVCLNKSC